MKNVTPLLRVKNISLYTGCRILIDRSKYPLKYAIWKKKWFWPKLSRTVGVIYLYSWPWPFFKIQTPNFDTGFDKSRKFYVRNYIFKFVIVTLRRYNQGQIVKLLSKYESVKFSLIKSLICLFIDSSVKKYFSLLNK